MFSDYGIFLTQFMTHEWHDVSNCNCSRLDMPHFQLPGNGKAPIAQHPRQKSSGGLFRQQTPALQKNGESLRNRNV